MFHRRNLPHLYIEGGTYFITFRLDGTIPIALINSWKSDFEKLSESLDKEDIENLIKLQKRFFQKFDNYLDDNPSAIQWLSQANIAKIVRDKLHELDGLHYQLLAYCIMPNHVHILFRHFMSEHLPLSKRRAKDTPLSETMQLIKGATARYCNIELGRSGTFWQQESYDHFVRNRKEEDNIIQYIVNNPIKANLIEVGTSYPYLFICEDD